MREFVPHGYKGIARNVGRSIGATRTASARALWIRTGTGLLAEVETLVRQVSVRSRSLTARGNSTRLLAKFHRVRRATNPVTFLSTLALVLEELAAMDLLWNHEVASELESRKRVAEEERRSRALLRAEAGRYVRRVRSLNLYDTTAVRDALRDHSTVAESLAGAIDRLLRGGPDVERQALLSCRSAIERLAMDKTGISDGKTAVKTLLPSETDHKPVVAVMNFLGGKIHGGSSPTRADAEYGLKLTIATLEAMANRSRPGFRFDPTPL